MYWVNYINNFEDNFFLSTVKRFRSVATRYTIKATLLLLFCPQALAQPALSQKKFQPKFFFLDKLFLLKWMQKIFSPNRWKAAEILDCLSLTESHHFHSLDGWGNCFMLIFNKLPYSLRSQGDKNLLLQKVDN